MRIRRKTGNCLNCGTSLDGTYNYCPKCGQENNDNNVSFGTLISDFFSNYFSFDSRFTKSFGPFLTKPGFLTNRYMEGKRMSYAHPLRLYLIISLFYFFMCSMVVKDMLKDTDESLVQLEQGRQQPLEFLDPEQRDILMENMSAQSMEEVLSDMEEKEEPGFGELARAIRENTTEEERQELTGLLNQVLIDSLQLNVPDSTDSGRIRLTPDDAPLNTTFSYDTSSSFLIFNKFEEIYELSKDRSLTEDRIIDSVSNREVKGFERHATSQGIRIMRAEKELVGAYIVKNLPIMMLILIPIFALVLKLFYIRRRFLYIHHVIHGFHLHSFAYLIYGITLGATYFWIESDGARNTVNFLIFVLVSTYAYISFLRVYKQGWFKTFVKFNLVGMIYFVLIVTFFLIEMFASFLSY